MTKQEQGRKRLDVIAEKSLLSSSEAAKYIQEQIMEREGAIVIARGFNEFEPIETYGIDVLDAYI